MMNKERELLRWIYDDLERDTKLPLWLRDRVRDFLASEPESYKPVAWTTKDGLDGLKDDWYLSAFAEPQGNNPIPLYIRPAPERKPMTVEDLETLARRCDYENDKMAHWHRTNFEDGFIAGWRQAEKHYGIGGEE